MKKQNYIGRKVKGFYFDGIVNHIAHTEPMSKYIGKEGVIIDHERKFDYYCVEFEDKQLWNYPASLIDKYLVSEEQDETEIRDQFAMQALNALCVSMSDQPVITLARVCYNIADAMLKARKEVKGE